MDSNTKGSAKRYVALSSINIDNIPGLDNDAKDSLRKYLYSLPMM